ncbi:MAG: hypothetical protein RLN60_03425 [Phycisphaerales bacterium]
MESASRKAAQEADRKNRKLHRDADTAIRRIERDADRIAKRVTRLHEQLLRDPLTPLNVRLLESGTFASDPFELQGEVLRGTVSLTSESKEDACSFEPAVYSGSTFSVEPLRLMLFAYGSCVAYAPRIPTRNTASA